jgi:hypothetical protein
MKKLITIILSITLIFGITSCKKDKFGCTDTLSLNYDSEATTNDGSCEYSDYIITDVIIGGEVYKQIQGTFDENYTLTSDTKWLLSGGVFVSSGAELTIQEGTTIWAADDGTTPFLSILRGGKINANGSQNSPIVFTTIKSNPNPGDWGGLILNGNAQINTGSTAEGEGGTGTYGGTNDSDNSGVLRYVRVEYAGKILGTDNELNGFSFNGVGSGTTVEYIQAYKGADDGIEFFGGTVNVRYAVSTGNGDDSFDWTHGWRGKGQFWVAEQDGISGDRGIEADNNGDNNSVSPFSNPTLSNLTLIGNDDGDAANTGMRLREGTKGKIYNAIVVNFPNKGVNVSETVTITNMDNNELVLKNSILYNNGTNFNSCLVFENDVTNTTNNPNLTGNLGVVYSGFDVSTIDNWFISTNYIGAVETNWLQTWTK